MEPDHQLDAARQAEAAELEVAVLVVVELRPDRVEAPISVDPQGTIGAVDVRVGQLSYVTACR